MRIIVIGLNEQGLQRQSTAGLDCVALTRAIHEIPVNNYDAALICNDNDNKYTAARFALTNKKHVLLEAPIWGTSQAQLAELEHLAATNNVVLYVAYNFRFVADFVNLQQTLNRKQLGEIQHCRIGYAANAESKQNGALIDLSPHLLDLLNFWFGSDIMHMNLNILHKDNYGRQIIFADFNSRFTLEIEANFLSRTNYIIVEIYGTRNNLHLRYEYTDEARNRISELEYEHFQALCRKVVNRDCSLDKWIFAEIERLGHEQVLLA